MERRIHGVTPLNAHSSKAKRHYDDCDNCWVCEGWIDHKFEYKLYQSGEVRQYPVFLHLDFEDYAPILMEREEKERTMLYCYRMLPPNRKVLYFFSNPVAKVYTVATGKPIEEIYLPKPILLEPVYCDGYRWQFEHPPVLNKINR